MCHAWSVGAGEGFIVVCGLGCLDRFYQILCSLTATLDIAWPPLTFDFLSLISLVINLNLFSMPFMGCAVAGSFVNQFAITTIVPPIIIGTMMLLQCLGYMHRLRVRRNTMQLLFLCYPRVCETIMQAFRCLEFADGSARLVADLSVECDGVYKGLMYPAAAALLAVYAVGVPVVFFRRLREHREVLHLPGPQWQLGFLYVSRQKKALDRRCAPAVDDTRADRATGRVVVAPP